MKNLLKRSGWTFSVVMVKGITSLLINKFVALGFGPAGITLLAHFQNLAAMVLTLPSDGVNRAVTRIWAMNDDGRQGKFNMALVVNLTLYFAAWVIITLFDDYFLNSFIQIRGLGVVPWMYAGLFLTLIMNQLFAVLFGLQDFRTYAIASNLGTLASLGLAWWMMQREDLSGMLIATLLGSVVSVVYLWIFFKRSKLLRPPLKIPKSQDYGGIFEFILMAASVLVFGKMIDFIVRSYAMNHFGMEETGLWQSVYRLSESYTLVFVGTLGSVLFSQFAAVQDRNELRNVFRQSVGLAALLLVAGLGLLALFGEDVLRLLYSAEFSGAYHYLLIQLTGDFFMLMAFVPGYLLLAKKNTVRYIVLQAISAIVYVFCIWFLQSDFGLDALLWAHLMRQMVFFAASFWFIRPLLAHD